MRSIGLPELVVLLGVFVFVILLPIVAIIAVVWFFVNRGRQRPAVASRSCGSCRQRVLDIGSYCSFCGQKIA
jgi:hypothetical protein